VLSADNWITGTHQVCLPVCLHCTLGGGHGWCVYVCVLVCALGGGHGWCVCVCVCLCARGDGGVWGAGVGGWGGMPKTCQSHCMLTAHLQQHIAYIQFCLEVYNTGLSINMCVW
jgi:hypothetical protein